MKLPTTSGRRETIAITALAVAIVLEKMATVFWISGLL